VCAACPTPRLNKSYELRPPWGQYLRYVPHRVRNGYNSRVPTVFVMSLSIYLRDVISEKSLAYEKNRCDNLKSSRSYMM